MMINNDDNIMVSIYCLCYNHEKYIRDTLDGILMQDVDFEYEVIIHDDASTDHSQEIIKEYMEKYPNHIRAILQTENQYSKGKKITNEYILPNLKGKYVAICECDDYWCDKYKLKKQVDFLEKNPEYSLCTHSFWVVDSNKEYISKCKRMGRGDGDIDIEDIIMNKDLPQTATFMYRKQYRVEMPQLFIDCKVGDYPLFLYFSTKGKCYYFDIVMSHYRRHGNGSWVTRMHSDDEVFEAHILNLMELLSKYDIYTKYKYTEIVKRRIDQCNLMILKRYKRISDFKNNDYFRSLTNCEKIREIFITKYPKIFNAICSIKRKIVKHEYNS